MIAPRPKRRSSLKLKNLVITLPGEWPGEGEALFDKGFGVIEMDEPEPTITPYDVLQAKRRAEKEGR